MHGGTIACEISTLSGKESQYLHGEGIQSPHLVYVDDLFDFEKLLLVLWGAVE